MQGIVLGQGIMGRKRKLKYQAKKQALAEHREQQALDRRFHDFFSVAGRWMGDFDLLFGRFRHHCGRRWQRWWWAALGVLLLVVDWTVAGTLVLLWGIYQVYRWWNTWDLDYIPTEDDLK